MNKEGLRNFLIEANKAGYASGTPGVKQEDGSTTIEFKLGKHRMHDNFFGGEPYGGREVIFLDEKPVWIMVYYGFVDKSIKSPGEIYAFLQKALSKPPEELPLRGPQKLEEGDFRYENKWSGDLERYEGEEVIFQNGNRVYEAKYSGGAVDARGE